jgi:hypothetical protein
MNLLYDKNSIDPIFVCHTIRHHAKIVEMMARVSTSDNLYLIQMVLSPKQYCRIMGGTVIYIGQK